MGYKQEYQRKTFKSLLNKTQYVPDFIRGYFWVFKSALSARASWSTIKQFLQWLIDHKKINAWSIQEITIETMQVITDINIMEFLDGLRVGEEGKAISLNTIRTKLMVIQGFFRYLADQKYIDDNVAKKIKKEKYKQDRGDSEIKVPKDEDLTVFLKNIYKEKNQFKAVRNICIVQLFLGSGIRSAELIGLDLEDVHLEDEKKPYIMILPKGNIERKRQIPISDVAADAIHEYLYYRELLENIRDKALFLSERKQRLSKTALNYIFIKYGDGKITPHQLRYWVGTQLYNATNDMEVVRKQLGHSNIIVTRENYVQEDYQVRTLAMAKINAAFNKKNISIANRG